MESAGVGSGNDAAATCSLRTAAAPGVSVSASVFSTAK